MSYLADTNIVFRCVLSSDPLHASVRDAVGQLADRGEDVFACPQNLIEFHAVATRPITANGLGMPSPEARRQAAVIGSVFPLLSDVPSIYTEWCALVDKYGATGRQVFDVRLVAVMLVHGITHILTMNPGDFRRFTEVRVVEPADIVTTTT